MGGSESKATHAQIFKVEDWEPIDWEPFTNTKDPTYSSNFTVYAHKKNQNLEIEKYQLFFNSQAEYLSYLETYYQRKKFPTLVSSLHIEQTTRKSMCSTFHAASVYLERIHFRLAELIEIPVEQGAYLIEACLEGYQKMFQKTGYFEISSDMIGINKQGKVKVWINRNFSKNFPDFNKIDHNKSEQNFILDLLKVIECSIDYPPNVPKFSDFLLQNNIALTFENTQKAAKQYQRFYKLAPQKYIKSIVWWIKKNNNKQASSQSEILNQLKTSSFSTPSHHQHNINTNNNNNNNINTNNININNTNNINNINDKHVTMTMTSSKKSQVPASLLKNVESRKMQINKIKTKAVRVKPLELTGYLIPLNSQQETYATQNFQNVQKLETLPKRNGAIHMSFMKQDMLDHEYMERLQTESQMKGPNKTINKVPSVSFCYKSSGLFSPQNMKTRQNQWFMSNRNQKSELKQANQRKKFFRKSLNTPQQSDQSKKLNFYCSSGVMQEIDPDIAKDLCNLTQTDF